MKKNILLLAVFSFLLLGCNKNEIIENENLNKVQNKTETNTTTKKVEDTNDDVENSDYFIEINSSEFKDMVNSNNSYIFFIGRDTCPACMEFKPIAKSFSSKEKVNIYYVNTTHFNDDDWNIVDEIIEVTYIPTIVITKNSEILYNEYGVKSYEILKTLKDKYL